MHSEMIPYLSGVKWSFDYLGRLLETPEGYKHALIALEHTNTLVVAESVKDLFADTVGEILFRRRLMIFGIAKKSCTQTMVQLSEAN